MALGGIFLSAEWPNLVMLNYAVDPAILEKFVPRDTELDSFQDSAYVSVVGFQFLRTQIFDVLPISFHVNFDEVNLRFYVRRREGGEVRRGVVFVKEIVPRRAIAHVARWSYGEKYFAYRMRHAISGMGSPSAEYEWKFRDKWYAVGGVASGAASLPRGPLSGTIHHRTLLGVIRRSVRAGPSNTGFHMCRGGYGQYRRHVLKAMATCSTGMSSGSV
jgi:hypothetical protein